MLLSSLTHGLKLTVVRPAATDPSIDRVTLDSRKVSTGTVFIAARGVTAQSMDGHSFVESAVALGASAIVVETGREQDVLESIGDSAVAVFSTPTPRTAAAHLAERHFGNPSSRLKVVGVTGTNGKTTSTFVLAQALGAASNDAAVFGTLGVGRPLAREALGFTTPEAEVVSEHLAALVDDGVSTVAMEVSSHALATGRIEAINFAVGAFTNFTQDHLDFHGDMESYLRAKASLFTRRLPADATAVLPKHLDAVMEACGAWTGDVITWAPDGAGVDVDVTASDVRVDRKGLSFILDIRGQKTPVHSPLVGRFNLENLLVAAASMVALGIPFSTVAASLPAATGVPGRMERVADEPLVIVDYAHTPDAITRALRAMKTLTKGRLFVVFGAGGDRDASKRRPMGQAAGELADGVILTSDNPRHEDPQSILDALEDGVRAAGLTSLHEGKGFVRIEDRAEAIGVALALATDGDAVLIAGKGAEKTQTIGAVKRPFDDKVVALACLAGGRA